MNRMLLNRESEGAIAVDGVLARATDALLKDQRGDGHWVFEL